MCQHVCADEVMALFGLFSGLPLAWAWVKARWRARHRHPHCVHRDPCDGGDA